MDLLPLAINDCDAQIVDLNTSTKKFKLQARLKRLSSLSVVSQASVVAQSDMAHTLRPRQSIGGSASQPLRPQLRSVKSWRSHSAVSPTSMRSPLIAAALTPRSASFEEPLPPTTNSMDTNERTKLLKSARKLSQILGETPILSDGDDSGAENAHPSRSRTRHTSSDNKRRKSGSLSRASRRPFVLPLSPISIHSFPTPRSPPILKVDCQTAVKRPREKPSHVSPDSASPCTSRLSPSSSEAATLTTHASSRDPLEVRRKKMAKLSRYLGENIPSELVFPSSSPSPGPEIFIVGHDCEHHNLRKQSSALSVPVGWRQRRKSESSTTMRKSMEPSRPGPGLKRSNTSRSLRIRDCESGSRRNSLIEGFEETLSRRQKSLAVKRASKMAQVFGTPPPHALFQITNATMGETPDDDPSAPASEHMWNQSHYSLTTSPVEPPFTDKPYDTLPGSARKSEYSLQLMASDCNTMDTDDCCNSGAIQVHYRREYTQCLTSTPSSPLKKSKKDKPLMFPCPPPAPPPFSDYRSAEERGHTASLFSAESNTKQSSSTPTTSEGPLRVCVSPPPPSVHVSPEPTDSAFRVRRRRAAKLSKFFGVGYHDLVDSTAHGYASIGLAIPTTDRDETVDNHQFVHVHTDVQLDTPTGFWGGGDSTFRHPSDIKNVMGKLREMRAL